MASSSSSSAPLPVRFDSLSDAPSAQLDGLFDIPQDFDPNLLSHVPGDADFNALLASVLLDAERDHGDSFDAMGPTDASNPAAAIHEPAVVLDILAALPHINLDLGCLASNSTPPSPFLFTPSLSRTITTANTPFPITPGDAVITPDGAAPNPKLVVPAGEAKPLCTPVIVVHDEGEFESVFHGVDNQWFSEELETYDDTSNDGFLAQAHANTVIPPAAPAPPSLTPIIPASTQSLPVDPSPSLVTIPREHTFLPINLDADHGHGSTILDSMGRVVGWAADPAVIAEFERKVGMRPVYADWKGKGKGKGTKRKRTSEAKPTHTLLAPPVQPPMHHPQTQPYPQPRVLYLAQPQDGSSAYGAPHLQLDRYQDAYEVEDDRWQTQTRSGLSQCPEEEERTPKRARI